MPVCQGAQRRMESQELLQSHCSFTSIYQIYEDGSQIVNNQNRWHFHFDRNSHNTLATQIPHQRVSAALNNRRIGRSSLRTEARATTNYDYAGLNAAPTELTGKVEVPVRPPAPVTRTVGRGAVESAMTSCSRRLGSCRIPLSFGAVDNRSGRWV